MTKLPNTPKRFTEGAVTPDGDIKRMMLDHTNYYATTGGHGACRGCGEVTAIRLVTSMSRALGDERRRVHLRELEEVVGQLQAKLDGLGEAEAARRARIGDALAELERQLYLYEGGPTGNGPAPTVVANSTGCSSVYASTMPFTPYLDPWVNSLFQDAQPLATGIFEGISAQLVRAGACPAHGPSGAGRRVRPGQARQGHEPARLAGLHPGRARPDAGCADHRR